MSTPPWSLRQSLTRAYLTLDPRSLGLGRIVLGAVLLIDLGRRASELVTWYTNQGLLPNHTVLWQPPAPRLFSFFFMVSLPHEAVLAFAICGFCYAAFLVGWRTRLFHVLSFLCAVSLHTRILYAEGAGSVVLGLLCFWTLFLPMGRRFSVDAVAASLRQHPEHSPADLARAPGTDDTTAARAPVISLAVLCLLLQLAAIYYFTYAHRTGDTWKAGTAVHYLLHQDRMVTALGVWARERLPFGALKGLTSAALALEVVAPLLLLAPVGWVWSRRLALLLLPAFHLGTALLLNLGSFAGAMLAFFPLLLSAEDWRLLTAFSQRGGPKRRRVVFFDVDCGVCFQIARVLKRMDLGRRLRWIGNDDRAAIPPDVDPGLLDRTILVLDPVTGRRWTRSDAFAEIFAALPFGRCVAWIFRLPILRTVAGAAYDRFAVNRTRISVWFGLAACGVPAPRVARTAADTGEPGRLAAWLRANSARLRELGVMVALVILGVDLLTSNAAVPTALRPPRPLWLQTAVMYPHLSQSWSMFAPDPPLGDQMVYVDALTSDGRHVDPYNQAGSRAHDLPVDAIPPRLGHSAIWREYTQKIPGTNVYHQAFLEWVLRFPERTGHAGDKIVSFEAWVVEDNSPAPGATVAGEVRKHPFLMWPR